MKCQIGIASSDAEQYGGRRTLPYVFTEQGISMLASVLRNKIAVDFSIGIMRAFVEMRRFIASNSLLFKHITNVAIFRISNNAAGARRYQVYHQYKSKYVYQFFLILFVFILFAIFKFQLFRRSRDERFAI